METKTTTGVTSRELSRELLYEGYTAKVECKNYWDSHGKRVEYEPTQHKFDSPKKFEIWKVCGETSYSTFDYVHQWEYWHLYIDGKKLDVGEIMSYKALKTKLKLDCCVGAG
jgi:hypothetical protein